jgi:nucleoside-diphosphate-sugar epimerase
VRVLIAGCGYVGEALGRRLAAEGHEVFGLRRGAERVPAPLLPIEADLADPATLAALPDELGLVFYLASAGGGGEPAYRAAYVEGVAQLRARLAERDAMRGRFVFASSTAVYGQKDGSWVDETSPTEPSGFRGRILLDGEARARRAPGDVVVRFGGIYGPGRAGLLERVRRGEASIAPGPPRYTNRIHRDDAAGVLRFVAALARPEPVYLGVDDDPASERELLAWLAARLGAAAPREAAPEPGSRRAQGNRRCSNRRLRAAGYRFLYPSFREGYGAILAEGAS